jgi:hypothetical protein
MNVLLALDYKKLTYHGLYRVNIERDKIEEREKYYIQDVLDS